MATTASTSLEEIAGREAELARSLHAQFRRRLSADDTCDAVADAIVVAHGSSVLGELARQERADPTGSQPAVATYEELARRLADVCGGGRFAHLLDRPTRLPVGDAPLVILGIAAVGDEMAAVVLLTILEDVGRRAERGGRDISLLAGAQELPSGRAGDGALPAAFAPDTLLDELHETYLRRRIRDGEVRAIAYLHAINDVALFLHPPTALSRARRPRPE